MRGSKTPPLPPSGRQEARLLSLSSTHIRSLWDGAADYLPSPAPFFSVPWLRLQGQPNTLTVSKYKDPQVSMCPHRNWGSRAVRCRLETPSSRTTIMRHAMRTVYYPTDILRLLSIPLQVLDRIALVP